MTAPLCRGCDAALPEPLPLPGFPYCGPVCRDAAVDRVIAREMGAPGKGRPKKAIRRRWCMWCGDEMLPTNTRQFCDRKCRAECRADDKAHA